MKRINLDLLGISELHWIGSGDFNSDDYTIYYLGSETERRKGVAFLVNRRIARCVESPQYISDRIMSIRMKGKPLNVSIIQVYAPTADAPEQEHKDFYNQVKNALNQTPRDDIVYVMGDFNAKVGEGREGDVVGEHGLGVRNESGDRLVQFCHDNRFRITNTFFAQPKRRLYTWKHHNKRDRNQIDFILCQQKWKGSVLAAKTLPGADCASDHKLLIAKVKIRLGKIKRPAMQKKFDVSMIPAQYAVEVRNRFDALELEGKDSDELWAEIRQTIVETAQEHVPYRRQARGSNWLTEATLQIADKRREAKAKGRLEEARSLNADFQREARKDKNNFLNARCTRLEDAYRNGRTRELFATVKQMKKRFTARQATIRDRDGNEISNQQGIRERWKEYTEELYASGSTGTSEDPWDEEEMEPDLLESEVDWALRQLQNNKAPGIDGIPAELVKPAPSAALTALCRTIWRTCEWPKEWKRSVFIPLPKKGDVRDCNNYRTIALIPHASKVLLKIIQMRLGNVIDRELPDVQAGFRKGRGTRDHIANLRWIIEKANEYQKKLYMCFVDYTKAFDCVEHDKLWKALRVVGVSPHLIRLIRSLYSEQEASVRTRYGDTEWFKIAKGTRQGCILSPFLFNLYAEVIMRKINLDEQNIGVKIGGRTISNLRYADDTTLMAESEKDLKKLILKLKEESEKVGLHLNIKKTKIMTNAENKEVRITINNEGVEVVDSFIFLGSLVKHDGGSTAEIRRRLALGRAAMASMDKIWKCKDVSVATKRRLVSAIVFPIATYGCETWTLISDDQKKIDSFELWCWRRLLRIPWTAKTTNKAVLERINPEMSLGGKIIRQKLSYFGHVMRANSLEKEVILGKVSGRRKRGAPKTRWLDTIKKDMGMGIGRLKEAVRDREAWREKIYRVSKSRQRLNG